MSAALPLARLALVAVAAVLAWRVVHVNALLYGEDGRPRLPVSNEREAAVAVLRANPAEVAALLVLAGERERAADPDQAARALESALRIAPIDLDTLQAAATFHLRHGRIAAAVAALDPLLEHHPLARDANFALLVQLLASREREATLAALATLRSSWLGPFLAAACSRGADAIALGRLLLARVSSGKARPEEVGCVTARLRTAGEWDAAYRLWLNALPRERLADVGYVFNGSFEYAPSGVGFDWMPATGPERQTGHVVEFRTASGAAGRRALRVTYSGKRQAAPAIAQYLAVAPGRYEMTGQARMEALQSVRGLQWRIHCVGAEGRSTPLAASERFIGSGEWQRFAFPVTVPPGCDGQVLRLEPVGMGEGTTYLSGAAWFDDLRLQRLN